MRAALWPDAPDKVYSWPDHICIAGPGEIFIQANTLLLQRSFGFESPMLGSWQCKHHPYWPRLTGSWLAQPLSMDDSCLGEDWGRIVQTLANCSGTAGCDLYWALCKAKDHDVAGTGVLIKLLNPAIKDLLTYILLAFCNAALHELHLMLHGLNGGARLVLRSRLPLHQDCLEVLLLASQVSQGLLLLLLLKPSQKPCLTLPICQLWHRCDLVIAKSSVTFLDDFGVALR